VKGAGKAIFALGLILAGAGLLWATVIGYYPSQLPALFFLLISGIVALAVGARMARDKEPNKAVEWRPQDVDAESQLPVQAGETALEAVAVAGRVAEEDIETTRVAIRRIEPSPWVVQFSEGAREPVTGMLLLGRKPVPNERWPSAKAVALPDTTQTVSQTHALIDVDSTGLWITDLDSTNGVSMVGPDGSELDIAARTRTLVTTSEVYLGDYLIRIDRG